MVTLSLADELVIDEDGHGLTVDADGGTSTADALPRPRRQPRRQGAGRLRADGGGPPDQAHPARCRPGRRVGRRRGRPALGRRHATRPWRPAWARTSPSAWSADGPGSAGWASWSPPSSSSPVTTCCCCRRSASTPRPCTGPGTTSRPTRGPTSWRRPRLGHRAAAGPVAGRAGRPGGERAPAGGERIDLVRRGGAPEAGASDAPELRVGEESARLVRVHTVPAGWEGD